MTEDRHPSAADTDLRQRLVEHDLPGRRGQQVLTTENVGDLHQRIVDRVDQGVERLAGAADEHVVRHVDGLEADLTTNQVVEPDRRVRHPHPDDEGATLPLVRRHLLGAQVPAVTVVPRRRPRGPRLLACLELLAGAEAAVRQPRLQQLGGDVGVDLTALGLHVRSVGTADLRALVPVQPEPGERVHQPSVGLGQVATGVGVLDPQHEGAAVVPSEHPVEQRAADVADVQVAGRRRGEPDPNLFGGEVAEDRVTTVGIEIGGGHVLTFGCLLTCG